MSFCFFERLGLINFLLVATKKFVGKKNADINENPKNLMNFLFIISIKIIYYSINMNTIFLFFLMIYIGYYLFRPISKKEVEKFQDPNNWSNMGF